MEHPCSTGTASLTAAVSEGQIMPHSIETSSLRVLPESREGIQSNPGTDN